MEAPVDIVPSVEAPPIQNDDAVPKAALTPPTSEDNDKREERLSSELSDIDSDDGEDIEPDHYFEGGKIPVFKPVRCTAIPKYTTRRNEHAHKYKQIACALADIAANTLLYRPWINSATLSALSIKSTSME
jgi:hypothetical protein